MPSISTEPTPSASDIIDAIKRKGPTISETQRKRESIDKALQPVPEPPPHTEAFAEKVVRAIKLDGKTPAEIEKEQNTEAEIIGSSRLKRALVDHQMSEDDTKRLAAEIRQSLHPSD